LLHPTNTHTYTEITLWCQWQGGYRYTQLFDECL